MVPLTFLADAVFDIMMDTADLSKRMNFIIASHCNSVEMLNNALTLIEGLCASGKLPWYMILIMSLTT